MNLEGKIDFIIRNVNKKDVIGALKDESKKYFVLFLLMKIRFKMKNMIFLVKLQ